MTSTRSRSLLPPPRALPIAAMTLLGACGPADPPGDPQPQHTLTGPPAARDSGLPAPSDPMPTPPSPPVMPPPVMPPLLPIPGRYLTVQPARFDMGAPASDPCQGVNEAQHPVTLTQRFELSERETSQADYQAVLGSNPSGRPECGADCPVEMISWHMAAAYCNALSQRQALPACYRCTGHGDATVCSEAMDVRACRGYRLPTEAEWEFAYRAGRDTAAIGGPLSMCTGLDPSLDPYAWYYSNADFRNHPGGGKKPNAWGFYDLAGSVWEWVHDGYLTDLRDTRAIDPAVESSDGLRVMRGGSYNCLAREVRASHRSGLPATIRGLNVGFRCARSLP